MIAFNLRHECIWYIPQTVDMSHPSHGWTRLYQWPCIVFMMMISINSAIIANSFTPALSHCLYPLLLASQVRPLQLLCFYGAQKSLECSPLKFHTSSSFAALSSFCEATVEVFDPTSKRQLIAFFRVVQSVHIYRNGYHS